MMKKLGSGLRNDSKHSARPERLVLFFCDALSVRVGPCFTDFGYSPNLVAVFTSDGIDFDSSGGEPRKAFSLSFFV